MKRLFIFRSGIRKIMIQAQSLNQAKRLLTKIEETAWSDSAWNWKIEEASI